MNFFGILRLRKQLSVTYIFSGGLIWMEYIEILKKIDDFAPKFPEFIVHCGEKLVP